MLRREGRSGAATTAAFADPRGALAEDGASSWPTSRTLGGGCAVVAPCYQRNTAAMDGPLKVSVSNGLPDFMR